MVTKMNKEKLLDEYIQDVFSDCEPITPEDRKYIASTVGFERFCLSRAWEEFKESITDIFPFNLLFGCGNK